MEDFGSISERFFFNFYDFIKIKKFYFCDNLFLFFLRKDPEENAKMQNAQMRYDSTLIPHIGHDAEVRATPVLLPRGLLRLRFSLRTLGEGIPRR